ncbi:MAG: hypothetical protein GY822_31580 [Deltaproteobacteria bacterium]|nr:hypothetical protein [Deltaproteobacteria bacterium]
MKKPQPRLSSSKRQKSGFCIPGTQMFFACGAFAFEKWSPRFTKTQRVAKKLLFTALFSMVTLGSAAALAQERDVVMLPLFGQNLPQKQYRELEGILQDSVAELPHHEVAERLKIAGLLTGAQALQCGEADCPPCPPQNPVCWMSTLDAPSLLELGALLSTDVVVAAQAEPHAAGIKLTLIAVEVVGNKQLGKVTEVLPVDDGIRARVDRLVSQTLAPKTNTCTLELSVQPEHADVFLDGKKLPSQSTVELEPGVYELKLSAEGLVAESQRLVIRRYEKKRVHLTLQTQPVDMMVLSSAATGSIGAIVLGIGLATLGASYVVASSPPSGLPSAKIDGISTLNLLGGAAVGTGAVLAVGGFALAGVSVLIE